MSTGTGDAEAVQNRHTQRRDKVPIRPSADLCLAQFVSETRGHAASFFKETDDRLCTLHRGPVNAAIESEFDARVKGVQRPQFKTNTFRFVCNAEAHIYLALGVFRYNVKRRSAVKGG